MKIVIAVAHADDETIGCYSVMSEHPKNVIVLHATNSAPRDLKYALRAGFLTRASYQAARRREILDALAVLDIGKDQFECLDIADQEAPIEWPRIRARVAELNPDIVYTHAYEGGHPDHDALALALAGLPNVHEFPLYHAHGAEMVPHEFIDGAPERTVQLTAAQQVVKRKMLGCFRSQQRVIAGFPIAHELFRPMRAYDFANPPHTGQLYYERRKLGWTWPEWRAAVRQTRNCPGEDLLPPLG
ncbi:MAG: PIG-L family deacetylase [Acidobacteria bacterium]|nr:PIG-L family deacetylase [Acidobacteriota bacterium]